MPHCPQPSWASRTRPLSPRRTGKAIKGATKATLELTAAMAGKTLTVVVTARRTGYQDGRATSPGVKIKK